MQEGCSTGEIYQKTVISHFLGESECLDIVYLKDVENITVPVSGKPSEIGCKIEIIF